jgi:glycine cleavage system H protein
MIEREGPMATLKFTKDHEWISADGDIATVGITKHATEQLGDVVFVEVPEIGRKVTAGEACAVVESVKAASDVYAPVSGEVTAANAGLADNPASVNEDPEGNGWFFKIRLASAPELDSLMDRSAYEQFIKDSG